MKTRLPAAGLALLLSVTAPSVFGQSLPYFEDFSSGSDGLNSDTVNVSGSLTFNNFTYSVDGSGGVALFDVFNFFGDVTIANISGLAVLGDYQWSGDTTNNVQTFTVASSDNSAFALTSLDFATGDGGVPTVFTITGYRGGSQVAQAMNVDLSLDGIYGASTGSEISTTDIAPDEPTMSGLHVVFSGSDWSNIDRFTFTADGNDILVILDNIQFAPASVIPEPAAAAFILGFGALALALRRRPRAG